MLGGRWAEASLKSVQYLGRGPVSGSNKTGLPSDPLLKVYFLVGYMKIPTKPYKAKRPRGWLGATNKIGRDLFAGCT